MKSQFLIAAPHSGAGKTTVTLGILRALRNQGLSVQPFKCGPDYLDPKLHQVASGRESINLDRFMMTDGHITGLYSGYGNDADVLVTEGVMGLFDGAVKMEGSSADIAGLLDIPVIMVVNAKAMAYSVAAVLLGFKMLRPELTIAGVIFNFVEHESHYQLLKAAAEDIGITALGFLPANSDIQIPSRHLGLKTGEEIDKEELIAQAAAHISKYIDLPALLRRTEKNFRGREMTQHLPVSGKKILVANDEAFNFTYAANITALSAFGEIIYFSPLADTVLPEADLIYLPGGYPELHLAALSANRTLMDQLCTYHQRGGRIFAECGGMMYLGNYIADNEGNKFPMAGILDIATGMQHRKLSLGYKTVIVDGQVLKGHEFHYSQFVEKPAVHPDFEIRNARNELLELPVFKNENLLASYIHFYFADNNDLIKNMLSI